MTAENKTADNEWLPPWSIGREAELRRYALQETQAPAGAPDYASFMRELFAEIGRLREVVWLYVDPQNVESSHVQTVARCRE